MPVYKSRKSRTAQGKSLLYECLIFIGYLCGIAGKLLTRNITCVFVFYLLNIVMVEIDMGLYVRSRRLDRAAGQAL